MHILPIVIDPYECIRRDRRGSLRSESFKSYEIAQILASDIELIVNVRPRIISIGDWSIVVSKVDWLRGSSDEEDWGARLRAFKQIMFIPEDDFEGISRLEIALYIYSENLFVYMGGNIFLLKGRGVPENVLQVIKGLNPDEKVALAFRLSSFTGTDRPMR